MDWGSSLLTKAGNKLRNLEQDVTKELGLRPEQEVDDERGEDVWDEYHAPDANDATEGDADEWEDIGGLPENDQGSPPQDIVNAISELAFDGAEIQPSSEVDLKLIYEKTELESRLADERMRGAAATRKLNAINREMQAFNRRSEASESDIIREKDQKIKAVLSEGDGLREKARLREEDTARLVRESSDLRKKEQDLQDQLQAVQSKAESAISRLKQIEVSEKATREAKEAVETRLRAAGSETRSREGTIAALEATQRELASLVEKQESLLANQRETIVYETKTAKAKVQTQTEITEAQMTREIGLLRAQLTQAMESSGWREDSKRQQLDDLRRTCQELESRNEELAAAVPAATRPLLRQIEQLQAESSERFRRNAVIEKEQVEKLREAEAQNMAVNDRERHADTRIGSLMSRNAALVQQATLRAEDEDRVVQATVERKASIVTLETRHREAMEMIERQKMKGQLEVDGLKEIVEHETAVCQRKIEELEASIIEKEELIKNIRETKKELEAGIGDHAVTRKTSSSSFQGAAASLPIVSEGDDADRLRDKYESVSHLQGQLASKEAAIQALAEEVVEHTRECDALDADISSAPSLEKEVDDLKEKHNALLALHGENEERIQESEQDIEDVKAMYKEQMTDLLLELERVQGVS